MKKYLKLSVFIVFSLFILNSGYSVPRGGQDLILPGHWVYNALLSIEMEMGRVTFGDQAPVSINELKTYLNDIDYDKLSDPGKKQYDRISGYMNDKNWSINWGLFSLGVEPSVNPEFYFKTPEGSPWIYDYTKRQALVDLPIRLGVGDYLSMYMGLQAIQNYETQIRTDNYINHVFSVDIFDEVITHQNYLSAGYMWANDVGINARFGIGTQSIGNSLMPSVIMSEYLTDTPYFNFRIFSPIFNYDLNVTQLTNSTYFYTHRLEARFFKKVELSFMEGVLPYGHFDLRFINPFAIFHGQFLFHEYETECSSFFAIKASFTPVKYLRLYFLYAQNEHTMAFEKDNPLPEGNGFQVGVKGYIPINQGYLHLGGEFYYASPYMFIKESPNVSFARVYSVFPHVRNNYYQWIGSPYGPDSIAFQIKAEYEMPGFLTFGLTYNFAALGENSRHKVFEKAEWNGKKVPYLNYNESEWVYPNGKPKTPAEKQAQRDELKRRAKEITPTGIVEYQNSIQLNATWQALPWLSVSLVPGYIFIFNADGEAGKFKQGFEISLATKINLTKISGKERSSDFLFVDNK